MPLYEFKNDLGEIVEEIFKIDECPKEIEVDGVIYKKTISSSSFRLKGEGFHANDYQ